MSNPVARSAGEGLIPVSFLEGLSFRESNLDRRLLEPVRAFVEGVRLLDTGLPVGGVTFIAYADALHLSVEVKARDRDRGEKIELDFRSRYPWVMCPFLDAEMAVALNWVARLVERHLIDAMIHEVREAIVLDGHRTFDPHVLRREPREQVIAAALRAEQKS